VLKKIFQEIKGIMSKLKLLDTTIRDGSYVMNFNYPKRLIIKILKILDSSGIDYIEIGHGLGIGAYKLNKYKSKTSDVVYGNLARKTLTSSQWGMFCIPGIASLAEVKELVDLGMNFIRIGTETDKHHTAEDYIKLAKKHNLLVCHNIMKSYTLTPNELALLAMKSESYGADVVYIVDSAGGMVPEQVKNYVNKIQEKTSIHVGFHGHDNLNLSIANSLQAATAGAYIIDGTMQGIGRGGGNASIEVLIGLLQKLGLSDLKYDLDKIALFSQKKIVPLFNRRLILLDLYCGLNFFHSSYLEQLEIIAHINGVSVYSLMREYTKVDKVYFDSVLATSIALRIKHK
jgi:4-hydroxy-2-oxovalerate aldolase